MGVYIVSKYELFIPLILLLAGFILFSLMFYKMNQLIKIELNFRKFFLILVYSSVFILSTLFYKLSSNIYYSILVVFLFFMGIK